MKFIVLNLLEERLQNINTFNTKRKAKLNSLDIIEFDTFDEILNKYYRLLYKDNYGSWHEYIISSIEMTHSDEGIVYHIFAENSLVEIRGDYIDDLRIINSTAKSALTKALSSSRWNEKTSFNKTSTTNFYKITAFDSLNKILNDFGGEIDTEILVSGSNVLERNIIYKEQIGFDLGKRYSFTKDITSIKKIINDDEIITALHGFGKGEEIESENGTSYGRKIDFSEINNGKTYVENKEATLKYGFNKNPRFGIIDFDDVTVKKELLEKTKAHLQEVSKPSIRYEVDVIDLKSYGVDFEGLNIGDVVTIRDYEIDESLKARVLEIDEDLDKSEPLKIVLGNVRRFINDDSKLKKEKLYKILSKERAYDNLVLNPIDLSNVVFMDKIVDNLNKKFETGTSNILFDENRGLIITDKKKESESNWIIEVSSRGFRIADKKKSDGTWDFRTFGTGSGFSADLIRVGVLEGGKIKFDLNSGTFLIGESTSNYEIYYDGKNLNLNLKKIKSEISSEIDSYVKQNIELLKGPKGDNGSNGKDGKDGSTWMIDSNGYWNKDGIKTEFKAQANTYTKIPKPPYEKGLIWFKEAYNFKNDWAKINITDKITLREYVYSGVAKCINSRKTGEFQWNDFEFIFIDAKDDSFVKSETPPSDRFKIWFDITTNTIKTFDGNSWVEIKDEETLNSLNNLELQIVNQSTKINQLNDEINLYSENITETKELMNANSTELQILSDNVNISFNSYEKMITENGEAIKALQAQIVSGLDDSGNVYTEWKLNSTQDNYARFGSDGIVLVSSGESTFSVSNGLAEVTSLNVHDRLGLGNHTSQKYATEYTLILPNGG